MARRGRKRKHGQRHESGKLVQPEQDEREDDLMKVARASRLKDALRLVDNPNFGTALGKAHLLGIVDERQKEAGILLEKVVRKYATVVGVPLTPRITARMEKLPGKSLKAEPDEKDIAKVKGDYEQMFDAVLSQGRAAAKEAYRVCLWGESVSWPYGLQTALTAIAEAFDIQTDAPEKSKAAIRIRNYAVGDYRPDDRPELRERENRSA